MKTFSTSSKSLAQTLLSINYNVEVKNNPYTSLAEKTTRCDTAKLQEDAIIKQIQEALPDYEVLSCEEWCEQNGLTYTHRIDSTYGDIMICQNGKTILNIDLKVGVKDYLGTPDALSLTNFGYTWGSVGVGDFVYLCINDSNQKVPVLVDAKKLQSYYKTNVYSWFLPSMHRTRKLGISFAGKVRPPMNDSYVKNKDYEHIYEEDYVPTSVIMKNEFAYK